MLKILPLSNSITNIQKSAKGKKKSRIYLTSSDKHLQDHHQQELMRYAIAGTIISKEDAIKKLKKRGIQKEVILPIEIDKASGQQFIAINQSSLAKRHRMSLFKIHRLANASNKLLLKNLKSNSPVSIEDNIFADTLETRIKEEAAGQEIIYKACKELQKMQLTDKDYSNVHQIMSGIPDKKLKREFQGILKKMRTSKTPKDVLNNFIVSLGWSSLVKFSEKDPVKDFEFRIATSDVFSKVSPCSGQGDIVISGYVLGDGRGDYAHLQKMTKKLHKKFPERKIHLIVISSEKHRDKLPILNENICTTHLAYEGAGLLHAPIIKQSPFEEDLSPLIQNCDLWVSGPVGILGLFDHLIEESETKGIGFTEYDCNVNSNLGKFGEQLRLGLKGMGIFTHKLKDYKWQSVANENLKNLLFETASPNEDDIAEYLSTHNLYMCYQSNPILFFEQVLHFSSVYEPNKDIDICFLGKKNIQSREEIKSYFDLEHLREKGIASIKWISEGQEITIPIQDQGKELRVINPGSLSSHDFKQVMVLSAPLVGCTGDHSFAQALSFGKIPYYEVPVGSHKLELIKQFYTLAANTYGENADLPKFIGKNIEIFKKMNAVMSEEEYLEFFMLGNSKTLIEQAQNFSELVHRNMSLNNRVGGSANQLLYEKKDPRIAALIDQLRKNYFNGTMSLKDVKKQLKSNLHPYI